MEIKRLHEWGLSITQARDLQLRLAERVSLEPRNFTSGFIAGVDISTRKTGELATGAAVVLSYPELRVVETEVVQERLDFPYIPGYLSFREAPIILSALERLTITPDLILVDGQGIAHPRRLGLASHLGLFLDTPTIGCAKSRLCGSHDVPGDEPGEYAEIRDNGQIIGAALRTKHGVKPVYVSVGHQIDLRSAIDQVMNCCRGYRLPEPIRLAHLAAGGNLKDGKRFVASGPARIE